MADTVAASVIVASLGETGPSFVSSGGSDGSGVAGAVHVAGAVSAPEPVGGLGAPLLVDFVTIGAPADPEPLPPTVSGHRSFLFVEEFAPVVPGGLHQT